MPKPGVLLVGVFASAELANRSVSEELAQNLAPNWRVFTTSPSPHRLGRITSMVRETWRWRHDYSLASVEVFSGLAFGWAETVCWTLRRARRPYVLTLHGGALPTFTRRWPRRVRRLLKDAKVVVAPSSYMASELEALRDDIRIIPNGVSTDVFAYRPRRHLEPKLLWARALSPTYQPAMAVEVLAKVRQRYPTATLTMVGPTRDPRCEEQVHRAMDRLGLDGAVTLTGGLPHHKMPAVFHDADIFLNTNRVDNMPVSVLEAMSSGTCVVTTNVGGIPHMATDGEHCLMVADKDHDAMAEAATTLLEQPETAARLSAAGRKLAESLDWGKVTPMWESLFNGVAQ